MFLFWTAAGVPGTVDCQKQIWGLPQSWPSLPGRPHQGETAFTEPRPWGVLGASHRARFRLRCLQVTCRRCHRLGFEISSQTESAPPRAPADCLRCVAQRQHGKVCHAGHKQLPERHAVVQLPVRDDKRGSDKSGEGIANAWPVAAGHVRDSGTKRYLLLGLARKPPSRKIRCQDLAS